MRIISSIMILLSVGCTTIPPIDQRKTWVQVQAPKEISRLAHANCFADSENFYVFSGIDEQGDGPFSNVGYTYNIENKSWEKWTNKSGPDPIQNFSSAKTDDHIYIFGGQQSENPAGTNKAFRFSLKEKKWELLPVDGAVDSRWRAGAIINGKTFLVYGGKGNKDGLNTAKFDLENQQWTVIETPAEVGSRVSEVITAHENRVFIFGGFIGPKPKEDGFVLDLDSKTWSKISNPILGTRVNPKFVATRTDIFVIGGATNFDEQQFGAIYNFENKAWKALPRIKGFSDFKGYEITQVNNEGILLWGGRYVKGNKYNDSWYFYRFDTNDWIELRLKGSPPGTIGGCLVSNLQRDVFALGGITFDKGKGLRHLNDLWILSAVERD